MELNLVSENDRTLSTVAKPWDFDNPPMDAADLAESMFRVMHNVGVGLAAPQIGISYRVFTVEIDGIREEYFNPEIVRHGAETEKRDEGCLSFGSLRLPVERSAAVTIIYQNRYGTVFEQDHGGLWARVCQHENDHLDGVCIVNKVSRLVLNMARKKLTKKDKR